MGRFENMFSTHCKKLKTRKCKEESFKTYGNSRKGIKSRATYFLYFFPEFTLSLHLTRPYPEQSPRSASEPSHQPAISRPLQSFYLHSILCTTVRPPRAECFITLRGRAQEKLSLLRWKESQEKVMGEECSTGWWITSMTGAATSCCCTSVQQQEDNHQQPGQGLQVHPGKRRKCYGSSGCVGQGRWSTWGEAEEVKHEGGTQNWRCWGESRRQMLSQTLTELLLLSNILCDARER